MNQKDLGPEKPGVEFDMDDPWHRYVHLIFAFHCWTCDAWFPMGDTSGGDPEADFLDFCVEHSEKAKALGWVEGDGWTFYCPEHAKEKKNNYSG